MQMKTKLVVITLFSMILIILFFFFIEFKGSSPGNLGSEIPQNEIREQNHHPYAELKTYITHSGKTITVEDTHPVGMSLSTVIISPAGFEVDKPIILSDIDPLKNVLISDLDKDGFDEIYLITQSAGSGSYGHVYAYVSQGDKSLMVIDTENLNSIDRKTDLFLGYRGHETYMVKEGSLVITFPVYNEKDSNAEPTGGTNEIHYSLGCNDDKLMIKIK